jgi:hypothetical protein
MKIIKKMGWRLKIAVLLIICALIIYLIQYFIFHQPKTELFYFGIDLAFLPIEVLLVVLVIETAISQREKSAMLEKLNMVIGVFLVMWVQNCWEKYLNLIQNQNVSTIH